MTGLVGRWHAGQLVSARPARLFSWEEVGGVLVPAFQFTAKTEFRYSTNAFQVQGEQRVKGQPGQGTTRKEPTVLKSRVTVQIDQSSCMYSQDRVQVEPGASSSPTATEFGYCQSRVQTQPIKEFLYSQIRGHVKPGQSKVQRRTVKATIRREFLGGGGSIGQKEGSILWGRV
jgi:hypothetical protein